MDKREASIVAQVASKNAAALYQGTKDLDGYMAAVESIHNDLLDRLSHGSGQPSPVMVEEAAAPVSEQEASNIVEGNFPGATNVYQPGPPKAISSSSTMLDLLEDAIFHNPTNWKFWDSEKSTARGGNSPDLTHNELQNDKGYKLGVFLLDTKFGKSAPQWAWDQLGVGNLYKEALASGKIKA